jgi:hypothetical protein
VIIPNPNRRAKITAQVHRFGDYVAVYIGTGETVYLTPKQARALSRAMNKAAKSCETQPFSESSGLTKSFDFSPKES